MLPWRQKKNAACKLSSFAKVTCRAAFRSLIKPIEWVNEMLINTVVINWLVSLCSVHLPGSLSAGGVQTPWVEVA